jgi:hypothetical protein
MVRIKGPTIRDEFKDINAKIVVNIFPQKHFPWQMDKKKGE